MEEVKSRLQSKTVRAVILAAIVSVLNAYVAVSGQAVDFEKIKLWSDIGLQLLGEGLTLGLLWKAYKGRVEADSKIEKLPWREEIANLTKGKEQ